MEPAETNEKDTAVVIVEKTFQTTKESYEIGKSGGKFAAVMGESLKNGWQWTDVIDIVKGVFEDAKEAAQGISSVDDEFKAEPFKASLGIIVPLTEGIEEMTKKLKEVSENDAIKEILKLDHNSRVIFASADKTIKDEVYSYGAMEFLDKPFTHQKLIHTLNKCLNIVNIED